MFYGAKEGDINIGTGNVHYITFGLGDKPLVMIPGLRLANINGGSKPVAWFYRNFAKEYKVYMFDRKDSIKEQCTIHDLAEDTVDVMKAFDIKNAYVFGASQGGEIAQDMAIHHPELIKKMVLGVTLSRPNPVAENNINLWIDMAKNKGLNAVAEDYTYKGFSESYLKKNKMFIPLSLKLQKFMDRDRFITLAKAVLTVDTYDRLNEIKCPVLVLGGGQDKIASRQASVEIVEKLGCEHYIYEDLGHEAYSESKDFNKRIYEFFKN
jgi:Predicted hydrolases or acyltransferases (alpha/beta hydrolase superfamily)